MTHPREAVILDASSPALERVQKARNHSRWIGSLTMFVCYLCWQAVMIVSAEPPLSMHITTLAVMFLTLIATLKTMRSLQEQSQRMTSRALHPMRAIAKPLSPPEILIGSFHHQEINWNRN